MNLLLGLAVCLTPLLVAGETPDGPGDRRPNVLLLLADDLGHADVGFNNPETFYETPRLDRLAGEGMRFSAAYAACPVCSPTRASLLAGRWPARMATTDYFGAIQPEAVLEAAKKGKRGRFQKLPLLPASYVNRLPLERVTLAEALREAGYATFFAGKWHLGGEGFSPTEQGFDVNVAGHHRGGPYGPGKYFHPFGMPNLESEPGDHLPARLAEETVKFVRANKAKPWFAMLSFYSVHTPLMGREDLVERYEKKRAKLGLEAAWGTEGKRKVRLVQEHAVYAAMVHAMDEAVGTVLDALEELELADDTLVIFFSDNGGLSTSEGHPTSNLPLRAGKGWLYEGGIREPCAVRWPGRIEAGTHSDVPVVSTDFAPSVLAACGLPAREADFLDGENLLGLWTGGEAPQREALYWHYPHWGNQGASPGGAVREGNFKWIEFFTGDESEARGELYDLSADIGERHDLAASRPELARKLRARLANWRGEVGARMPTRNPLIEEGEAGEDE